MELVFCVTFEALAVLTMEKIEEHLKDLRDVDEPKRQAGIQYLEQICNNILSDPSNPKFRDLDHSEIEKKLDQCQPALLLLFDVGFIRSEDNQRLRLESDDIIINNIQKLKDALEAENAPKTVQISMICYCHQPLKEDTDGDDLSHLKCRSCWKPLVNSSFDCNNGSACIYKQTSGNTFWVCPSCYQQDAQITCIDTEEGRKKVFAAKLRSNINAIS